MAENSGNVAQCFICCFALRFGIKKEVLSIIRFLLQMKCKVANKTLQQRFSKEFKATCKNSGKSELKQQKNDLKCDIGWLCTMTFNYC